VGIVDVLLGRSSDGLELRRGTVLVRSADIASRLRRPQGVPASDPTQCPQCKGALDEAYITTHGDPVLWRDHPIAVDGWVCKPCMSISYPRRVPTEHVLEIGSKGLAFLRKDNYLEAEPCFARIVWDWPGFAPGHLSYADVTRMRLKAERATLDATTKRRLRTRMLEHFEMGVEGYLAQPDDDNAGIAAQGLLVLAGCAFEDKALDKARRHLDALFELRGAPGNAKEVARDLMQAIDKRLDLFDAAAIALKPFLARLYDKGSVELTGEDRRIVANALVDLEAHLAASRTIRWQSELLHAQALIVAGRDREGFVKLKKLTMAEPSLIDVARDYSLLLMLRGLYAEALQVDLAIANQYPLDPSMWGRAAVSALLAQQLDQARNLVARATSLFRDEPLARKVGLLLARPGSLPATLREFDAWRGP
jgi:hypothetical protein